MTESNLKILVLKKDLKTRGLYPTSQELYDLMYIITCERAIAKWQEEWSFCPVCLARYKADGNFDHQIGKH